MSSTLYELVILLGGVALMTCAVALPCVCLVEYYCRRGRPGPVQPYAYACSQQPRPHTLTLQSDRWERRSRERGRRASVPLSMSVVVPPHLADVPWWPAGDTRARPLLTLHGQLAPPPSYEQAMGLELLELQPRSRTPAPSTRAGTTADNAGDSVADSTTLHEHAPTEVTDSKTPA